MTNLTVTAKFNKFGTKLSLYERAKADKKPLTLEYLYGGTIYTAGILKAYHDVRYNEEIQRRKSPFILEEFTNVDDVALKRASETTVEGKARQMYHESELAEREQLKANPPVYDRSYVERAQFTLPDLYNDIVSVMEYEAFYFNYTLLTIFGSVAIPFFVIALDWTKYRVERSKFRSCRHKFCMNMFAIESNNIREDKPKRRDSRFCCDECRKSHTDSNRRYNETGSYLPRWFYAPDYDESVSDRTRKREAATPEYTIEGALHYKKKRSEGRYKKTQNKPGKVFVFSSLEDAKKVEEKREKVSIIAVYREIIRR
ncbi:hypothetical protein ACH0B6_18400 [Solibacillus silvestris]